MAGRPVTRRILLFIHSQGCHSRLTTEFHGSNEDLASQPHRDASQARLRPSKVDTKLELGMHGFAFTFRLDCSDAEASVVMSSIDPAAQLQEWLGEIQATRLQAPSME